MCSSTNVGAQKRALLGESRCDTEPTIAYMVWLRLTSSMKEAPGNPIAGRPRKDGEKNERGYSQITAVFPASTHAEAPASNALSPNYHGQRQTWRLAQETTLVGKLNLTGADFHHGMIIRSRLGEPAGDGTKWRGQVTARSRQSTVHQRTQNPIHLPSMHPIFWGRRIPTLARTFELYSDVGRARMRVLGPLMDRTLARTKR